MKKWMFQGALDILREQFDALSRTCAFSLPKGHKGDGVYRWPGGPGEEILICVHKSNGMQEAFHRHDYFYFNYTYRGRYDSLSDRSDCRITIREGELYAGQPWAGHALCAHDDSETIIIGVLIQRDLFYRSFLPMLSADSQLLHFFMAPDCRSQEHLHLKVQEDCSIRILLEMMVVEFAYRKKDTQEVLKPLALSFLLYIARQCGRETVKRKQNKLSEQLIRYMSEHSDTVTLRVLANRFSYNPNYLSMLLHRAYKKTFTELLLELRMRRAATLLRGTELSNDEIALTLGYSNSSNFYKAFRGYYGCSPRKYLLCHPAALPDDRSAEMRGRAEAR